MSKEKLKRYIYYNSKVGKRNKVKSNQLNTPSKNQKCPLFLCLGP